MDVTMRNNLATVEPITLSAGVEQELDFSERDDKIVIAVIAESAAKLTVKAGNGLQGVCDLVLDVPMGLHLLKLESGRFKFVSGEHKGKIVVSSSATISVGIAALV